MRVFRAAGPAAPRTADDSSKVWCRVMIVNLTGVFYRAKHQVPLILWSGGGAIVNISSIMGLLGTSEIPAYVASKHGVLGLTKAIADEYGAAGLRCNAVAPGMMNTRLTGRLGEDPARLVCAARDPSGPSCPARGDCRGGGLAGSGQGVFRERHLSDGGWRAGHPGLTQGKPAAPINPRPTLRLQQRGRSRQCGWPRPVKPCRAAAGTAVPARRGVRRALPPP